MAGGMVKGSLDEALHFIGLNKVCFGRENSEEGR